MSMLRLHFHSLKVGPRKPHYIASNPRDQDFSQ